MRVVYQPNSRRHLYFNGYYYVIILYCRYFFYNIDINDYNIIKRLFSTLSYSVPTLIRFTTKIINTEINEWKTPNTKHNNQNKLYLRYINNIVIICTILLYNPREMSTMILFSVCSCPTTVGGWKRSKPRQRRVIWLCAGRRWSPRGARGCEYQRRRIQRRRTRTTDENIRNCQQGSGQFGPRLDTGKF